MPKQSGIYYINYNKIGSETLKEIYEVDYFLIFPDMRPKQYWDIFITILVIILCFLTPWRLAFVENDNSLTWLFVDTFIDFFFIIDIIINFFTVFTNKFEDYVIDRKLIALNYLYGWFLFDFISVLPFGYFLRETKGLNELTRLMRITRLYKMIKIFRLVKQSGKIQRYAQEMLKIGMVVERAIGFFFLIGITTHIFACLWYFLAKWNNFDPDTWVARTGFQDEDVATTYIFCYYFIMQVLTTVGYGDISIYSSSEKILVILIMMIGVVVFSFAFGSLISVLTNLDSRAAKLKEKTFELNSIKKKYNVPESLYEKIFKDFKFEVEQDENMEVFIKSLPAVLRTDLVLTVNHQIINQIPYFKCKNEQFCAAAASFLKSSKSYAGDLIYEAKDPILEIFFLLTGEAGFTVSSENFTIVYSKIQAGNLFGELDYFCSQSEISLGRRQFTVKAIKD